MFSFKHFKTFTGKHLYERLLFNKESLLLKISTEKTQILLKHAARGFQNIPRFKKLPYFVTITGNFERFQYFIL